jgi:hypothetical protein
MVPGWAAVDKPTRPRRPADEYDQRLPLLVERRHHPVAADVGVVEAARRHEAEEHRLELGLGVCACVCEGGWG